MAKSPKHLPPYTAEAAALFDDKIDALAVGLADVASQPATDLTLRSRTRASEVVGRMRVATVTVDSAGGKPLYHLSLVFLDRAVARRGFPEDRVEIAVRVESPAFGVVKWLDTKLIGRTFVGFVRRFAAPVPEGEAVVRFHLSPDTPEVLTAVQTASALGEIAGP